MLFGDDGGTDFRFGDGGKECRRLKQAHLFSHLKCLVTVFIGP